MQPTPNRIDVNIPLTHSNHHDVVSLSAFSRALMRSSNAVSKNGCGTLLESKTVTFFRSVVEAGLCERSDTIHLSQGHRQPQLGL
jgi:hypothetical protein